MPWLLLIFSLPSKRTSERVGIWRKLQKYGTLALRNSGYVLPNTPANQERLEWLATAIRGFKGEASVLQVRAIDDLPSDVLKGKFREERKPDYAALIRELQQLKPSTQGFSTQLTRLKRRFEEVAEIDFFESPLKAKAEEAIYKAEHPVTSQEPVRRGRVSRMEYQNRVWITRPRPGIDRVSSAWAARPEFRGDPGGARAA
ncbi:Chromate resistance protein ChrB [Edaphobacter aggregans]|uniref:Chromate resistance protein ChrB n=1 Tax=Edaphobacter aggregans TaxID=570835 RepID=UPI0005583E23|nr:Chromate resistance protein ChrB [Edaphobacter aggregans]